MLCVFQNVLGRELENMWEFLEHDAVRLPLDPSMLVRGVDVKVGTKKKREREREREILFQ